MRCKLLSEIEGFEGCTNYIIYENGSIYSKYKEDFLHPSVDSKGYMYISLKHTNSILNCPKVHKLVMLAFVGRQDGMQINHKDGDKSNNQLSNLEYVTNEENRTHALNNGLKDEVPYYVDQYDLQGNKLNTFRTCEDALLFLGIQNGSPGNIGRVIRGKRKTAYGYIWKSTEGSTTIERIV
jgi:hypothetical protein